MGEHPSSSTSRQGARATTGTLEHTRTEAGMDKLLLQIRQMPQSDERSPLRPAYTVDQHRTDPGSQPLAKPDITTSSRQRPAVPDTPKRTRPRRWPDFKWNAEIGQAIPVTPEPMTEPIPTAMRQDAPQKPTFLKDTHNTPDDETDADAGPGAQPGKRAWSCLLDPPMKAHPKTPMASMRKRKAIPHDTEPPAKQQHQSKLTTCNETTPEMFQWREIEPDAFRIGFIETADRTWYTEDGTTRPAEMGYCIRVHQLNHTTKCYYIPHDYTTSEWPDGLGQHVEAFFNTHPEADRSEASYGFLV